MRLRTITPSLALIALAAVGCGGGGSGGYSSAPKQSSSSTVSVRHADIGDILVDGSGRTVYLFEKDKGTRSSCAGACADAWPPVTATGAPQAGKGVSMGLLGTTKRADGSKEITYNGHPLYRYAGDAKAGDTKGQGLDQFGAEWYALDGAGKKVEDSGGSSSGGSAYGY